jgi:hypothetical protein
MKYTGSPALSRPCDYCYFPSLLQLVELLRGAPVNQMRKQIMVSWFTAPELHDAEQRILIWNKLYGSFIQTWIQTCARYTNLIKSNKGKRCITHITEEKKVEEDMLSEYVNLVKVCTLRYCTIMHTFYSRHAAPVVQHVLNYISAKGKTKKKSLPFA